jgi:hypothetical protein
MQDDQKKQAREYLIQAKLYRFFASTFAVVGALIFLLLYFNEAKNHEGDVVAVLRNPFTIVAILFPFLPSIILSMKAKKAEGQLNKLIGTQDLPKGETPKAEALKSEAPKTEAPKQEQAH